MHGPRTPTPPKESGVPTITLVLAQSAVVLRSLQKHAHNLHHGLQQASNQWLDNTNAHADCKFRSSLHTGLWICLLGDPLHESTWSALHQSSTTLVDDVQIVKKCNQPFSAERTWHGAIAACSSKANKRRVMGSSCHPPSPCIRVMDNSLAIFPQTSCRWPTKHPNKRHHLRESRSNAPMRSIDITVAIWLSSVNDCNARATHSLPASADNAH